MNVCKSTVVAILLLNLGASVAKPIEQHIFVARPEVHPLAIENSIDPLKHLSAISPFFIPSDQPSPLPASCTLNSSSLLIRHSSILGNDDEFEMTMQPFIEKIYALQKKDKLGKLGIDELTEDHPWAFLRTWKSPIVESHLEELSEQGATDAESLGKYFRTQYAVLFPPLKSKHHPFHIWTASSDRDIVSSKSFIKGAFPTNQTGDDGEGDGKRVQLIRVPNKGKVGWDRSLTPHKACDAFDKAPSLKPAAKWLNTYAPLTIARISNLIPKVASKLSNMDILAMQMLCGYETIAQGTSGFCKVFTDSEWLDAEYYFDIRFHYMMGYGNPLSPQLGMPWVRTAAHLLAGEEDDEDDGDGGIPDSASLGETSDLEMMRKRKERKLPIPKAPPNATHTQDIHPFFTHRESPAFVTTFLNLYNTSTPSRLDPTQMLPPSSHPPPLTHRPEERTWRTSEIVPFLGHIALERFRCPAEGALAGYGGDKDFVRVLVNGKQANMGACDDGIEGSCGYEKFQKWVEERVMRWNRFKEVCEKK